MGSDLYSARREPFQAAKEQIPVTSTREVVDDLLRRISSGDPHQIAAAYADRVDWQLDWPEHWHGGPVPWVRYRSS